jgi:glycosyltransferase involved in cell wall biosynthesis
VSSGRILLICAVRNEVAFISKLISSLQNQTYSNWVLHIRDNASTDGTDSIIRQFQRKENRIHMTSSPIPVSVHVNWAYAINEALLISSDFASCIAGDDYYEKSTHLESLVAAIHDSVMCALPQFRLNSDTINISMPTKASPESMRRNHFRLSAGEVYVMAMYSLFKRSEFERILNTRSGRWPTTWEPTYDYWFALEALRSAQSVPDETYIKFVKGIGHTSAYYNPESKEASLLPRNVNTKIFSMFRSLLFEAFVDPPKFFLSSYKRVSLRDLLWIPLFLLVMSGSRFGKIILLSIKFLWKPDGFRTRFRNAFKTSTGR